MKFKRNDGYIVEANTLHDINILKNNPNYTEIKEKAGDIEEKSQPPAKKGGK